jgi:hypothetical protein
MGRGGVGEAARQASTARYGAGVRIASVWLVVMVACGKAPEAQQVPPANQKADMAEAGPKAEVCLADEIGELRTVEKRVKCGEGCLEACGKGDGAACFESAVAVEETDKAEAKRLFERGCRLGLSVACTNYAGHLVSQSQDERLRACAMRLFAKACEVKEPYACGTRGIVVLLWEQDATKKENARRELARACDELKGFPCHALAMDLEHRGAPREQVEALMARACEGGDDEACARK